MKVFFFPFLLFVIIQSYSNDITGCPHSFQVTLPIIFVLVTFSYDLIDQMVIITFMGSLNRVNHSFFQTLVMEKVGVTNTEIIGTLTRKDTRNCSQLIRRKDWPTLTEKEKQYRLRVWVFNERIVNMAQPCWLSLKDNEGKYSNFFRKICNELRSKTYNLKVFLNQQLKNTFLF